MILLGAIVFLVSVIAVMCCCYRSSKRKRKSKVGNERDKWIGNSSSSVSSDTYSESSSEDVKDPVKNKLTTSGKPAPLAKKVESEEARFKREKREEQ